MTSEGGPLRIIDCTEPLSPREVATVPMSGLAAAVVDHMLCVVSSGRFHTIDVTDPEHPVHLGTAFIPPSYPADVAIDGTRAYVASEFFGLTVIDLSMPEAPRVIGGAPVAHGANGVAVDSRAVYVAGEQGLTIFPRQCPGPNPVELGSLTAITEVDGILLRWSAHPQRFSGYWVERAPGVDPREVEYVVLNPIQAIPAEGPWEFLDSKVTPGSSYAYRVRAELRSGGEETIGPVFATAGTATGAPHPNLIAGPNPSSGLVTFTFTVERSERVEIEIYDTTGRLVRSLERQASADGRGSAVWDGRNAGGRPVARGRYMARISSPTAVASASVVLLAE